MVIISKQNPLVKELAALKDRKFRRERGRFLVEGEKMVRECLQSGMRVLRLIVREGEQPPAAELPVVELGADAFASVCDEKTPQGVCAEVQIPREALVPPKGNCLLLDGVSDPANMGAIIRTANAAGYEEIYCAGCTDPFSPKSVRASMSGIFFVRIMQGSREEVLSALSGTEILAMDMAGENIFSFLPPARFALAVGNEAHGLSPAVRAQAAHTLRIPMRARAESLNAAVSASIGMYLLQKSFFQQ